MIYVRLYHTESCKAPRTRLLWLFDINFAWILCALYHILLRKPLEFIFAIVWLQYLCLNPQFSFESIKITVALNAILIRKLAITSIMYYPVHIFFSFSWKWNSLNTIERYWLRKLLIKVLQKLMATFKRFYNQKVLD